MIGAMVGALTGLFTIYVLFAGILLGSLFGAMVGASCFPRATRSLSGSCVEVAHSTVGTIQASWIHRFPDSKLVEVIVLTEHALYAACEQNLDVSVVLDGVARNQSPEVANEILVWLDAIVGFEMVRPTGAEIIMLHRVGDRVKRRSLSFESLDDKTKFLGLLEQHFGHAFHDNLVEMEWWPATRMPLLLMTLVGFIAAGVAWLAGYWQAFPPPPPMGKAEQDELVQLLTWVGPAGVVRAAVLPCTGLAGWMVVRLVHRPRVHLLTLSSALANVRTLQGQ